MSKGLMNGVRRFSSNCFKWLYPSRCELCSLLGDDAVCANCLQDFVPIDRIQPSSEDSPLRATVTLFPYQGRVGQAVRRLKYSRATALVRPMSSMISDGVARLGLGQFDFAVPI